MAPSCPDDSDPGQDRRADLEARLHADLSRAAAIQEGFLISSSFAESLSIDYALPPKTLLGVQIGEAKGTASAWYRVDLGVPLSQKLVLSCPDRCIWELLHPEAREASIDFETMKLDVRARGWASGEREIELRERLLELLDIGVDERVHSPAFWSVNKETVRANLERVAHEVFADDVEVSVVFEGESRFSRLVR